MKYYNKINRNVKLNLKLYFNKESYNRRSDPTPRFFVNIDLDDPIIGIERLAWTHWARRNSYAEYTPHFFGGSTEKFLKDSQVLDLINKVNKASPYGYDSSIVGSRELYDKEVKYNPARQSFWKSYWEKNTEKVKTPNEGYPYIKISNNEMIRTKFIVNVPKDTNIYGTPISDNSYVGYKNPPQPKCEGNLFEVTWDSLHSRFLIDGESSKTLNLAIDQTYTFINKSWNFYGLHENCVTGLIPFRFSTVENGLHTSINGLDATKKGETYLRNINYFHPGSLTEQLGSETINITVDKDTPRILHYYSPEQDNAGGIISVNGSCPKGTSTFSQNTLSGDWHSNVVVNSSGSYITVKASSNPNHCARVTQTVSGDLPTWVIPSSGVAAASQDRVKVPYGPIGIAIDGVPFHNIYTGDNNVNTSKTHTKDACNGYVDSYVYNYKIEPTCIYHKVDGEHSPILGYAFDGYPIYGPRDDFGATLINSELDEYHGHEQPGRGYHYHITSESPYILGEYYKGVPYTGNFN